MSFLNAVNLALDRGWIVEVWTWRTSCNKHYRDLADRAGYACKFSLHYLDDFRDFLTLKPEGSGLKPKPSGGGRSIPVTDRLNPNNANFDPIFAAQYNRDKKKKKAVRKTPPSLVCDLVSDWWAVRKTPSLLVSDWDRPNVSRSDLLNPNNPNYDPFFAAQNRQKKGDKMNWKNKARVARNVDVAGLALFDDVISLSSSPDTSDNTCLFWRRGFCRDGDWCKFKHGK